MSQANTVSTKTGIDRHMAIIDTMDYRAEREEALRQKNSTNAQAGVPELLINSLGSGCITRQSLTPISFVAYANPCRESTMSNADSTCGILCGVDTDSDTERRNNVETTHENHAVRRSERPMAHESGSFDFIHQYELLSGLSDLVTLIK